MMQHNDDFCTKFLKSLDKILTQSSKELLPNICNSMSYRFFTVALKYDIIDVRLRGLSSVRRKSALALTSTSMRQNLSG
jgi:hypothetical protein